MQQFYKPTASQKERYLRNSFYSEQTKGSVETVFNSAAEVEDAEGMDLCEFTHDQIIQLFKAFNYKSKDTLLVATSYLSKYYAWCEQEGLIVNSCFNMYDIQFSKDLIDEAMPYEMASVKYIDEEDVVNYLPRIIDVSNKFIFYASFRGLKIEDLIDLKITDFDETLKTINLKDRILEVDDTFIFLMKLSHNSEVYLPYGESIDNKFIKLSEYVDSDYILKPTTRLAKLEKEKTTVQILQRRIGIIKKQIGNKYITLNMLNMSGLICYLSSKLAETGIDLKDAFEDTENYYKQIDVYIQDFGFSYDARTVKYKIKDYLKTLQRIFSAINLPK